MPLIRDPSVRASLYPKVEPLLDGLPERASAAATTAKGAWAGTSASSCRASGTLTLAEVEVFSDGRNVARRARPSQKNTAARRRRRAGRSTATRAATTATAARRTPQENTDDPWWEVDLGEERPSTRSSIYNRTDGDLGKRLDGFTLEVLDGARKVVFEQTSWPAADRRRRSTSSAADRPSTASAGRR